MDVQAITKYARMSHQKMSEITRQIQGLPAAQAVDVLRFTCRKSARVVERTLRSAIANAENNAHLSADTLIVKEAVVGTGPTFKRWKASARGMAAPRLRRTCHVKIVVCDGAKSAAALRKPRQTKKVTPAAAPATDAKPVAEQKPEQK